MRLTSHFNLDEFLTSDAADHYKLSNEPTPQHLEHLQITATGMEQVRAVFGRPIVISSAYRSPAVNAKVGGTPTSDHPNGWACDFHVAGFSDYEVALRLASSEVKFDQLIYEKGRCVHISFNPRMRGQVLSQPGHPGSPVFPGINP